MEAVGDFRENLFHPKGWTPSGFDTGVMASCGFYKNMYAVIKTGGKQYLVKEGQEIKIEKLAKKSGDKVEFDALLVFDDKGEKVEIGKPKVEKAKVSGAVLAEARARKIAVIKYKRKTRYKKNVGHRQWFTKVKISSIVT